MSCYIRPWESSPVPDGETRSQTRPPIFFPSRWPEPDVCAAGERVAVLRVDLVHRGGGARGAAAAVCVGRRLHVSPHRGPHRLRAGARPTSAAHQTPLQASLLDEPVLGQRPKGGQLHREWLVLIDFREYFTRILCVGRSVARWLGPLIGLSVCRLGTRSAVQSVCRSFGLSIGHSVGSSIGWSVCRSVGRSGSRFVYRLVVQLVGRSAVQSVGWSGSRFVGPSFGRSSIGRRSFGRRFVSLSVGTSVRR